MFSPREITDTGWLQYCISKDDPKAGDLCHVHDFPHNDFPAPDRSLSFSVFYVEAIEAFGGLCIDLYPAINCA